MIPLSILNIIAIVVAASAAAIPTDSAGPGDRHLVAAVTPFNITNFSASAVVLSHRDFYQFNLSYHADLPPIHCEAMGTTLSEDLGSIPQTYCESESTGVSFQWTRNSDNTSDLLVVREVDDVNQMTDEAIYHVSSNDTPLLGEGLFAHMVYTGPEDFSVPAFRFSV